MPGPVELRVGNASQMTQRRMPQLRELLRQGFRGADVKAYLHSYREALAGFPRSSEPSDIFVPLAEAFFARSSFDVRQEMAEKAKEFALGYLGQDAELEERITLQVIDRVIRHIDDQGQYRLRDILWLISDEARRPLDTIDQFFLERMYTRPLTPFITTYLEALKADPELNPEDRPILEALSRPEMLPHLETLLRDVSKLELKGPEKVKTLEKILLGLREMGLDETALHEAPLDTLRRAYLIGSLKEYSLTGRLPMHEVTWLALKNILTDPRLADAKMLAQLSKLENLRWFILGITGLGMSAETLYSYFLSPLNLPEFSQQDINKLFDRVLANGRFTEHLLSGFESDPSFIIEELTNYGKGTENSTIIENVSTRTDPIRTTVILIEALNNSSVESSTAASLIDNIIKTRETVEEKDEIYYELASLLERTDIPMSDRRMETIKQIFSWHPEAMGTVLDRYLELYDRYRLASVQVIGFLSSGKSVIDRLETFILSQIQVFGNREMAKSLLAELMAQTTLALSQKLSEALILAMNYTGVDQITRFNLYYQELMHSQLRTIPTEAGQLTVATFLPRSLLQLTLDLLRIGNEIQAGNLAAARQTAEAAVEFANENGLRAALVRYLAAFLGISADGRITEKSIEELKIAILTDKNDGLRLALDLVQGILKNEVYTQLEDILMKMSPINLPPRLAILGNILRDQHLTERENRFELARQLMEKLEKDKLWVKVLDLVETYQYDKAQTVIAAWIKEQLVSA